MLTHKRFSCTCETRRTIGVRSRKTGNKVLLTHKRSATNAVLHTENLRHSLFHRERKRFSSRAQTFFIVSVNLFYRDKKTTSVSLKGDEQRAKRLWSKS